MINRFIHTLILALAAVAAMAQTPDFRPPEPPGMQGGRLTPPACPLSAGDSAAISQVRARMDSIRVHRPTVALVMSGGGAKGAAHIGVLKYLESIDMPVDMVLGTSMGGLVGGLYALGYSAHQLDSIIRTINWSAAMTDAIPREYISYAESKYKEKYVLSIPFYYDPKYYRADLAGEFADSKRHDEEAIKLGADLQDSGKMLKKNLLGSLPSGYVYGQNVQNIIDGLSVGYQDSLSFAQLPIPFFCAATELVSGRAKYWFSGSLSTAMRSTMSIPGVFAPVKTDGMVLVDGGMRDNYPTGLARELGADIVIGMEVSSDNKKYDEINNIGDIISQGIDMLGRAVYDYNKTLSDINIHPHLPDYDMMSFDPVSIDKIIEGGYEAAQASAEQLLEIKSRVAGTSLVLNSPRALDINMTPVTISEVDIRGVNQKDRAILGRKIDLNPGDIVSRSDIEHIIAEIFGTQCFDYVTYELEGQEEPFQLVINCKPGPVHQVGVGVRLDSDELVSLLLNVGLNAHRLQGSKYEFTGRISVNPYFKFHYYYDAPKMPTLNATAAVRWTDMSFVNFFNTADGRLNLSYLYVNQEFYISNLKWSLFDLNGGIRNEYFDFRSMLSSFNIPGDYDLSQLSNDYVSLFAEAKTDTFDDGYFPTKGFSGGLSYSWTFAGFPHRFNNFHTVQGNAKVVVPWGKVFAFIPSVDFRFLFGEDVPLPYINVIGGSMRGRYMTHQIPFVGINKASAMSNILTVFRTDFRFRVAKNHYVTGIVDYVRDCNGFSTYAVGPGYFGAGLEYSFNAFFGPVSVDVHWSDITRKTGFYINIGYFF